MIAVPKRLISDDSGAVAVIFAIVFLVIVGFSALAVDVGYWYTAKRQLQSAADAAALAGCNELAHQASTTAIEAAANDYATRNFTAVLDAAESRVESTEIGADYVKVTAATDAHVFLARWLLNRGTTLIRAQAVAKIGYLAGGRGPVPWGLSIINIGAVSAGLGGQDISLSDAGSGYWSGTFSAGRSGPLTVHATNGQGYTEDFVGLVSVAALPSTGRVVAVDVNKTTFTSGIDSTAHVTVTLASALASGGKIEMTINGKGKVGLTRATDTLYEGNIGVGTTEDPYATLDLEVTVSEGRAKQTLNCGLLLRRANYILQDIALNRVAVLPSQTVTVSVKPLTFKPDVQYQMKVEGGAGTTGNYQALDLATIDHSSCGYPVFTEPGQSGGGDYRENIVGNADIVLHLHDYVTTLPGDKVGPTGQGIDERLLGTTILTVGQWIAAGKPETKQLCIVPICEKIEDQTGRSVLRVVNFATFFLEVPPQNSKDPVIGTFIEWTDPGWFVVDDPPPGGLVTLAVHLTDDYLDF